LGISFGSGLFSSPPFFGKPDRQVTSSSPFNERENTRAAKPLSGSIPAHVSACGCGGSHGPDFDHAAIVANGGNPGAEFERFKARQYADILSHEQAHQSAAGSLGGGVHIQFDGNGVAVSGHVPIAIPGLDRQNPEISYKSYNTVRSAALAPGDPSGQDCAVASQAQSLMGQAQVLMAQKKQAQSAGLSLDDFQKRAGKPMRGESLSP
jgi:hypothetical protein